MKESGKVELQWNGKKQKWMAKNRFLLCDAFYRSMPLELHGKACVCEKFQDVLSSLMLSHPPSPAHMTQSGVRVILDVDP